MEETLRQLLKIPASRLDDINNCFLDPNSKVMNEFFEIIAKYGSPVEINRKHIESRKLENLYKKIAATNPAHIKDLEWLIEKRDSNAFISRSDFQRMVLGTKADQASFDDRAAVTLPTSLIIFGISRK
jgi:hypothetical protein